MLKLKLSGIDPSRQNAYTQNGRSGPYKPLSAAPGQRRSQDEQDGSEVRSVELECLIVQGQAILERQSAFETMRDLAAGCYETETGSRRPRAGSPRSHSA